MDEVVGTSSCAFPLPPMSSILAVGPSKAGKSSLIHKILMARREMLVDDVKKILYFYGTWSTAYETLERYFGDEITFIKGLPSYNLLEDSSDPKRAMCIVLDDVATLLDREGVLKRIFCEGAHHLRCYVFMTVHNIFEKSLRTISLNTDFIVLMKSFRNKSQIGTLGAQFNLRSKFLQAYESFTEGRPHSYLMVDVTQQCPDHLRLRTNILPNQTCEVFY